MTVDYKRLCESDQKLMNLIWDNEPIPSGELARLCLDEFGWKKSTSYTILRKLIDKGLAKNEDGMVSAAAKREEVMGLESAVFVERSFGGSLPGFLVSFLGGRRISKKEADELRRLIDEYEEDGDEE
ncbi:MAG: BlaI/MecI/CopY family transcriptional regulator [Clostridia bacterium]|jgi:predicted transcriptional regulator|nr:BlaI/MecI/CopY family transcriptional regulator [Clostridia bacterium]